MSFRILIADDDVHARRILSTLLSREPGLQGPEVVAVGDGVDAIAALDRFTPDLVISDLLMPRMDGFTFARALRARPECARVPLLLTSAIYKEKTQLADFQKEVGAEFFAKPYQLKEMVRTVLRILVDPTRPQRPQPRVEVERPRPARPEAGSLAERPLPRLLFELFDADSTGVLSLSRARLRKEVFILLGHPIGAESNLRAETLGQLLIARGLLEPSKLAQAMTLSKTGHDRLGAVLIQHGFLSESEVMNHLATQVRLKIVNALRWSDGEYRFVPGDTFSGRITHLSVDTPRVVLSGLKRTAHVGEVARAAGAEGRRVGLSPRLERHRDTFVAVFGEAHLLALAERPRGREVAARGDSDLLLAYEALLLCGLGQLEAEDAARPAAKTEAGATPGVAAGVPREAAFPDLFADEEIRHMAALARGPISLDMSLEDSGVFALPLPPPARATTQATVDLRPPPPADPAAAAARDAILREYLTLHSRNHYDRLRVDRSATAEQISAAFTARSDELRPERFAGIDLGRHHGRLEEILAALSASYEVLSDKDRRAAYDRTLTPTQRRLPTELPLYEAEERFREGARLLHTGQAREALAPLAAAVRAAPEQADYHALLGWARFEARDPAAPAAPAVAEARASLEQALAADPDHAAAHEFAGRIAFFLGEDAEAIAHLSRALRADPTREEALSTLRAACLRSGQPRLLEEQLRSLIGRLGDSRAGVLWHELGVLLRDHLGDSHGARLALETYARLVPDASRSRRTLDGLRTQSPLPEADEARKRALAFRAEWRAAPDNDQPLRALFRLHVEAVRPDAALLAASALAVRGADDADAAAFVKRYRPRFLQRAVTQLGWGQVDEIRHPDDDRELAALFTRLFAAAPPEIEGPPPEAPRLSQEALPLSFGNVLGYVAWLLGVAPPRVVVQGDLPATGVRASHPSHEPPILLVGPQALAQTDKAALAFRLGRALSALYPARAQAQALSSLQLKAYLGAATTLLGTQSSRPPDAESQRLCERLAAYPDLATGVRPLLSRLSARSDTVNLSRWLRGIARTAERVGLVAAGDLSSSAAVLVEERLPTVDLVDFALSEELLVIREALGLSIAV